MIRTETINSDGSRDVRFDDVVGQSYTAEDDHYDASGAIRSVVRTHADGSLANTYLFGPDGTHVTSNYDATGALVGQAVTHADGSGDAKVYDGAAVTAEYITYAAGAPNVREIKVFDGTTVSRDEVVHADGSRDVEIRGTTFYNYTTEHDHYDPSGILRSAVRTHADGTLSTTYAFDTDGTTTNDFYDPRGVIKERDSYLFGDHSTYVIFVDGVAYQTHTDYDPGHEYRSVDTIVENGVAVRQEFVHPDLSRDVDHAGITGQSYVAEHDHYDPTGTQTAVERTHADGSLDYTLTRDTDGTLQQKTYYADGLVHTDGIVFADGTRYSSTFTDAPLDPRYATGPDDVFQPVQSSYQTYAPGSADSFKAYQATSYGAYEAIGHAGGTQDVYKFTPGASDPSGVATHLVYHAVDDAAGHRTVLYAESGGWLV